MYLHMYSFHLKVSVCQNHLTFVFFVTVERLVAMALLRGVSSGFYGLLRRHASTNANGCTIYSLSSGHVKCGVSVIRVSGPKTKQALRALVNNSDYEPKQRQAYLKAFYHPVSKDVIDKGLLLWFPGPASFTGEDACEFQVHGSLAVIAAMLDALGQVPGLRPAQPGEFTKRAFFGGKLDLTEVDGIADLIHAETEAQRKQVKWLLAIYNAYI